MSFRLFLVSLVLTLAPTLTLAQECNKGQTAMSCAEGFVLDTQSGTCVAQTTS